MLNCKEFTCSDALLLEENRNYNDNIMIMGGFETGITAVVCDKGVMFA